ncbi:MAG: hypothetical protein ACXVGR_12615 [Mycobacteriaceae bacterium]
MGVYPENVEVKHRSYVFDGGTDAHGNPTGALADPVTRYAFTVYQVDWQHPHPDPISIEYLDRTIAEIILMVSDPYNYKKLDEVQIFNGAEWQAYEVMNQSISWGPGFPWQRYANLFGGEVHGRRVN